MTYIPLILISYEQIDILTNTHALLNVITYNHIMLCTKAQAVKCGIFLTTTKGNYRSQS
jgi:hypothetical protein